MIAAQEKTELRGVLKLNESMQRYNSWRVGGHAERLYIPADLADLQQFIGSLPAHEPRYVVGLGSNLLVPDAGISGTVVIMHNALNQLYMEHGLVYAEAGVTTAKVARFCIKSGLSGAEFLAGIPGTMGGALAMNAGCHGGETWDLVSRVMTLDSQGSLHQRQRNEFVASYRHVQMPQVQEWFVAAWLDLPQGDSAKAEAEMKQLLAKRLASQPLNLPNAGSTFRNPPGDHAARLIEACGLKGKVIGGAQISSKHANFIVNLGNASARDIQQLIDLMRASVQEKFGVQLQQEVKLLG